MVRADPNDVHARGLELVPSPKRVRVLLGRRFIADSRKVVLLRERRRRPVYYFPVTDVARDALVPSARTGRCPRKGALRYRHVQVVHGGMAVADCRRPVLLFETGLPTRYYLPKPDVRLDLLVPNDSITRCPYKGEARYYSVVIGGVEAKDLFWTYRFPTVGMTKIAGLCSFLAERVDELWLDGELQARPDSPWSTGHS